jgi:hypothetical protein
MALDSKKICTLSSFAFELPVVDDSYTAYLPSFLRPVGTLLDSLDAARDRLNLPEPGKLRSGGHDVRRVATLDNLDELRQRWHSTRRKFVPVLCGRPSEDTFSHFSHCCYT